MEAMPLLDAAKLTSPNPVTLICSLTPAAKTNLATISWITFLSVDPPRLGFAMMKTSYSGELIRENKEAIVTVPGVFLARAAMGCGATSGRTADKAAKFGIELVNFPGSAILVPKHSAVAIQCALVEYVDVGDHYFYICDAKSVYGDPNVTPLFAWNGYAKLAGATRA